jgi:hypothetical protein
LNLLCFPNFKKSKQEISSFSGYQQIWGQNFYRARLRSPRGVCIGLGQHHVGQHSRGKWWSIGIRHLHWPRNKVKQRILEINCEPGIR